MSMKYCYHCGREMDDAFHFCPVCGSGMPYPHTPSPIEKSYTVGAKIMGFVSMGLGIAAVIMCIANTLLILAGLIQLPDGRDPELFAGFLFFALFTLAFSVPSVILATVSIKKDFPGSSATVGRAFGIMGCITGSILLILAFLNL